ncbi:MAG: SPOR domain-containing protein [Treponema sp.]|nr:SPOR domain-containing protein [Treponema sp.]
MDKEMKKLLLVAVSVGVFLLVTITVSLIILTPKAQTRDTAFSSSAPYTNARPIPDIMSNMPVQPLEEERQEAVIAIDRYDEDSVTVHIPSPIAAAIPEAPVTRPANTTTVRTTEPAVRTTQPAARTTQPAARTTQPAARTTQPAARTTPASSRAANDFWIQTGAYPSMVGAEDVRERLASNGLVAIVSVFEDGRTWYRVRLGPYTSEREANHWLTIVKSIDGFSASQIRQTIRQQ